MEHKEKYKRDELLELLWHLRETNESTLPLLKEHKPMEGYMEDVKSFQSSGIILMEGEVITLTAKGLTLARGIVRRHRLAERLVSDVLGKGDDEMNQAACEFEHILAPEIVDSICILLGHPKNCPHGLPIPAGDCCAEAKDHLASAVTTLSNLDVGMSAKIASINTKDEARMFKLMSMGLTPGSVVLMKQKVPAIVVKCGEQQLAIEKPIADEINIWRP